VTEQLHPAEQYVEDILSGKIASNEYIRWACQRHRDDLARVGTEGFPYRHEPDRAQRVIDFGSDFCRHVEGEWAGQPIVLSPADQFMVWVVFGWVDEYGNRRFREVYEEKARKNAKTTKLAVIGNYMLDADGEEGARVYCAATKLDQARLLHRIAAQMVRKSPALRKYIQIHKDNLHVDDTFSRFEPLGRDSETLDGLNPSCALIDEYHAHPDSEIKDVVEGGMGARKQPLIWTITTAGKRRDGPCWELRDYAVEVLKSAGRGECINEQFAVFIYCIEEQDDPFDEACWVKANPNLSYSVKVEDLRAIARKATRQPRVRASFLQKRLGVWTGEVDSWISLPVWNACRVEPFETAKLIAQAEEGKKPRKPRMWLGFDLSAVVDMTALVAWVPYKKRLYLKPYFFLAEGLLDDPGTKNYRLYRDWADAKLIEVTPGRVVRYRHVREKVRELAKDHDVIEIGGDKWNASDFIQSLEYDGFAVWVVVQTVYGISEPAKKFEELVTDQRVAHEGHPVMDWMMGNIRVKYDDSGNVRPTKKKSAGKIDGPMAAINGLARWMERKNAGRPAASQNPNRDVGFRLTTI
jgi:phage terminase large subunit-like protein